MTGCPVKLPCSIKCRSKNEEVNFCSRGGPAAGQPPDRGQKKSVYPKAFLRSRAGYGRGGALFFFAAIHSPENLLNSLRHFKNGGADKRILGG